MRQWNRESQQLTGWSLCCVSFSVVLCSSSWSLSPSPSSPRSVEWRRKTTWIFWREWYRKVSPAALLSLFKVTQLVCLSVSLLLCVKGFYFSAVVCYFFFSHTHTYLFTCTKIQTHTSPLIQSISFSLLFDEMYREVDSSYCFQTLTQII